MKTVQFLICITLILTVNLFAQERDPQKMLSSAREKYQERINGIEEDRLQKIADLNKSYTNRLRQIKSAFVKKEDLDGALECRAEIEKISGTPKDVRRRPIAAAKDQKSIEEEEKAEKEEKAKLLREAKIEKIAEAYEKCRSSVGKQKKDYDKYKDFKKYLKKFDKHADEDDLSDQKLLVSQVEDLYAIRMINNPIRLRLLTEVMNGNIMPALKKSKLTAPQRQDFVRSLRLPVSHSVQYAKEVK